MNYALIGCGRISTNHIQAALDNGLDVVAVCDIRPAAMEELLTKHGLAQNLSIKRYTDYKQLLAENKIDLLSIATESGSHAEIALHSIDKGVAVIIEKPMALSMADAREIVRRSQEKGVKVAACHQNRFNLAIQETRRALEAGRFGRLSHGSVHVRWHRNKEYYDQAPWRGTWAQDGGCLMNQCIHGIDLLRWMMGDEIQEVYSVTRQQFHEYLECEDLGMAVVTFKNGTIGTIEGTTNVHPSHTEEILCLFGENGTVQIGGNSANTIDVWGFAQEAEVDKNNQALQEATTNVYGNGHTRLFADMIDAMAHDRAPYVDAVAGKNAVELILAMYQSAATGKPVCLPLADVSTTDFIGRFDKE